MKNGTALMMMALAIGTCKTAAAPLDKDACESLKAEYTRLQDDAMKADLEKGPEWGKSNLSETRLKEIQRFIETEEQFLFRCPQPKIAAPAGGPEVDGVPLANAAGQPVAVPPDESPNSNPGHVPDGPKAAKPATQAGAVKKQAANPGNPVAAKPAAEAAPKPKKPAPATPPRAE